LDNRKARFMKIALPLGTLLMLTWSSTSSAATPTDVWFAGGDFSDSASLYGGSVVSMPGSSLGHGLAVRTSAGFGRYNYDASGTKISGKYVSAEAALVHQSSGKWGWVNFSVGPRFSHTTLSPVDPKNGLRGSRVDVAVQSDGALDSRRSRLNWLASYGFRDESYLGKLEFALKAGHGMAYGIQTGIVGDPSYHRFNAGGLIRISFGHQIDFEVGGGLATQPGRTTRPYLSVGLSQVF